MKGKVNSTLVVLAILVIAIPSIIALGLYAGYLSSLAAVPPVVTYDGEFDDGFVAEKYGFWADATETTDCNITSDVLGGSTYSACVYNSTAPGFIANQSTKKWEFDYVIDIDGPVEKMDVDIQLQNTGTLQAQDDIVIEIAELYRYDEGEKTRGPVKVFAIDDNNYQVDDSTGMLLGDEYVLHIVLSTKAISPSAATGDDVMKIDLDLTTDGDVDSARILFESW